MHIVFIEFDYMQPQPQHCRFSDITWGLASALVERGHRVTVVGPYLQGAVSPHPAIDIQCVPKAVSKRQNIVTVLRRAWHLGRRLLQIEADMIHVHQSVMAAALTLLGLGHKTVWHGHSNYYYRTRRGQVYDRQMNWLIRTSTHIAARQVHLVSLGKQVIAYWERAGVARERIATIPNGMIWPSEPIKKTWSSVAWQQKRFKLLYIGRLAADKGGQSELIEALAQVKPHQDVGLAILGDGKLRSSLEQQVIAYGLQDTVSFLGHVSKDEVQAAMASADLYILTSYSEMLPRTILEAWVLGTPVMATNVGAIGDYLINQQNGYLLTSHDPAYIAQRIRNALDDGELRREIGLNGRQTAQTMTWEQLSIRYEQLYRTVLQHERTGTTQPVGQSSCG